MSLVEFGKESRALYVKQLFAVEFENETVQDKYYDCIADKYIYSESKNIVLLIIIIIQYHGYQSGHPIYPEREMNNLIDSLFPI